ncbi:hypothetical protein D023_0851A, partial [Vibrio parahaemolyticus 3256]
MCSQSFSSAR